MYPADITHSSSDAAACPAAYRMISSTAAAVGTHRCRTAMITSTQKHACKTDFVGYVDEMSLWGDGAEGWLEPRISCTEVQATFRDVAPDTASLLRKTCEQRGMLQPAGLILKIVFRIMTDLNIAGAANQAGVSKRAPSGLTAS